MSIKKNINSSNTHTAMSEYFAVYVFHHLPGFVTIVVTILHLKNVHADLRASLYTGHSESFVTNTVNKTTLQINEL